METPHNYKHLQFLIIDDFLSFCRALQSMVLSFGVAKADAAHNGNDALSSLLMNKYDVVLCDYNLGEGRNGNDLLEEIKHDNLLKNSAIFMMITAETSPEMVRGALEYQPDDYLTKPVNEDALKKRLDRLLDRNQVFQRVHQAMDSDQLQLAIQCCDEILAKKTRYTYHAYRLKAELLMRVEDYPRAQSVYEAVLQIRILPWVKLGLGKSYFHQGQLEPAIKQFQELIDEDKDYTLAWDWLSRAQEAQGNIQGAQQSLHKAVSISPINIKRQMALGDIAVRNGDYEEAERAFSRSVKFGKNSISRSPDNYIKLSQVLVKQLESDDGQSNTPMENKASQLMHEVRELYPDDPKVVMQSQLVNHQICKVQGKEEEAERALLKAYEAFTDGGEDVPAQVKEELAECLEAVQRGEMAQTIVSAMESEESGFNTQAIKLYDQGEVKQSLEMLRKAQQEHPRSFAINLNLAQVSMHYIKVNGLSDELMEYAAAALKRVENLPEDHKRYEHYQRLLKRYQQLVQQWKMKQA